MLSCYTNPVHILTVFIFKLNFKIIPPFYQKSPSGIFASSLIFKFWIQFSSPTCAAFPYHPIPLVWNILIFGEEYKYKAPHYAVSPSPTYFIP
jgi:hypothetical protein